MSDGCVDCGGCPKCSTNKTPLINAARRGRAADVAKLLADGADANEPSTDGSGYTALYFASQQGHARIVTMLLEAKAKVNVATADYKFTPLYAASERGYAGIVTALLRANARVDQAVEIVGGDESGAKVDLTGFTALCTASKLGHADCVVALLDFNANVNQAIGVKGFTPLWIACEHYRTDVVKALLSVSLSSPE